MIASYCGTFTEVMQTESPVVERIPSHYKSIWELLGRLGSEVFYCPLSPLLTCTFYPTPDLAFVALPTPIVSLLLSFSGYSSVMLSASLDGAYYLLCSKGLDCSSSYTLNPANFWLLLAACY